jgi:biotin carboxyl carrier protein
MAGVTATATATDGALRATALDAEDDWLVVEPAEAPAADGSIVVVLAAVRDGASGRARREVVVDGWRFEVEVEPERRARLRERAARASARTAHHGSLEVRAVIPGRIVAVAVNPGDEVAAGDRLVVIEAMKMQNDVRAPRAGRIRRVAVGAGQTVELRDVLVELE